MTSLNSLLPPSPVREAPDGPTLAREAGTTSPKPDEKPCFLGFQEFSGQNTSKCSLRARRWGLSTAARRNKTLKHQAKLDLNPTRNQTRIGMFSGGQLGGQLGLKWGSIKTSDPHRGHPGSVRATALGGARPEGASATRSRESRGRLVSCHVASNRV